MNPVVRSPGPSRSVEGPGHYHIPLFRKEIPSLEPIVIPDVMHVDNKPGGQRPVASVDTDKSPAPYDVSTPELFETPIITENQSLISPPAAPQPHRDEGVQLEGFRDNMAEVPDARPPVVSPVVIKDPPTVPPTKPRSHPDKHVRFKGFDDNIPGFLDAHPPVAPPVVIKDSPTVRPAGPRPHPDKRVRFEGFDDDDNIAEVRDAHPPAIPPVVIKGPPPSPPPSVLPATPSPDPITGISFEGWINNIMEDPTPSVSSAPSRHDRDGVYYRRPLPLLHEIKQRLEQATAGKIKRIAHPDQSSISLSIRRWTMRLLMYTASLSPADFAPSVGYLGPAESTPYYPTGDLQDDRSGAYTTAMNCLEDLEVDVQINDAQGATKFFELAQALSDVGLHEFALYTCGYASESFDHLYIAEPNKYRLRVASVLSLQANILCDLKRNNEARDAADRAVILCKEHRDSQAGPVPELAYALLNYAVLLCFIGLKDGGAAVAFELLCEDDMGPEMTNIFTLCKLCISITRIGTDDNTGMEMAEETIELSRTSSDANTQAMLAGALLAKSKVLSSTGQNDVAPSISAEAVTVLRSMSATRPVFSLFLAHALDTHAHHLSEANRKGESYATRHDAVEHWQTLKATAGDAVTRPLAYSLFHLANFRSTDEGKNARREELRLAESAVDMFRQVVPLDAPGLGDALYLIATRMLDLDDNREAATYAEESIQYFHTASAEDAKYKDNLILSLSLASSCLACTERAHDAFEYAKRAVDLQHERKVETHEQYNLLLRKLLMDTVARAVEIDRHVEALPYFQELQAIGGLGGIPRISLFDRLAGDLTTDF